MIDDSGASRFVALLDDGASTPDVFEDWRHSTSKIWDEPVVSASYSPTRSGRATAPLLVGTRPSSPVHQPMPRWSKMSKSTSNLHQLFEHRQTWSPPPIVHQGTSAFSQVITTPLPLAMPLASSAIPPASEAETLDEESACLFYEQVVSDPGTPTTIVPAADVQRESSMIELAKTQSGSRYLQDQIDLDTDGTFVNLVLQETFDEIPALMMDLFANYMCQRVIMKSSPEQRQRILSRVSDQFLEVSCDRQGTRVMQRLVQFVDTDEDRRILFGAIKGQIVQLMHDQHGSYVINAIMEHVPAPFLTNMVDEACRNCTVLGLSQHGLFSMKKCLTIAAEKERDRLSQAIIADVFELINNQFGNYLLQHVLMVGSTSAIIQLHRRIQGHYCELSQQKFSSNVVERMLAEISVEQCRREIIDEFLAPGMTLTLLQDSFGNYVMQNALALSNGAQLDALIRLIFPQLRVLRNNVQKKWSRLIKNAIARRRQQAVGSQSWKSTNVHQHHQYSTPKKHAIHRDASSPNRIPT